MPTSETNPTCRTTGCLASIASFSSSARPAANWLASAETNCRTAIVTQRERLPVLTVRPDGTFRTEWQMVTVHRPVRRCP